KQDSTCLLELLQSAYNELDTDQRNNIFGEILEEIPLSHINGKELLKNIKKFQKDSLNERYYAPFDINSKNCSDIPEETDEWFDKMGDFLQESTQLTEQGENAIAVKCFTILYELIERLDDGEEIVFADELGSWMIPGDKKKYIKAYLSASSASTTPEEYAEIAIPLIRSDSYVSFADKVYSSAIRLANPEQKKHLRKEVKRENIRTK
ncbi:MAG: hypothetical protein D3923_14825, partial [Candidatus Electrothrix sp. AR3]|nr:hypothetical protein [Candidatus Electrothrix sp. AR3]